MNIGKATFRAMLTEMELYSISADSDLYTPIKGAAGKIGVLPSSFSSASDHGPFFLSHLFIIAETYHTQSYRTVSADLMRLGYRTQMDRVIHFPLRRPSTATHSTRDYCERSSCQI